jgi:hypothetical protein
MPAERPTRHGNIFLVISTITVILQPWCVSPCSPALLLLMLLLLGGTS